MVESSPRPAAANAIIYKLRELKGVEFSAVRYASGVTRTLAEILWLRGPTAKTGSRASSHRYEVNNQFLDVLSKHGLRLSGLCPDGGYVEIVEVPNHPWFLACQFHPEFKSKPLQPHPLFRDFIQAAHDHRGARARAEKV